MNTENYRSFVKLGTNTKNTRERLLLGAAGICFLSILCSVPGLFRGPAPMYFSISVQIIAVCYFVIMIAVSRNLTFYKRVLFDAVNASFSTVLFTLNFLSFAVSFQTPIPTYICVLPIVLAAISLLVCYIKCKTNKYIGKKNNPLYSNLVVFSAIGVILGRFFIPDTVYDMLTGEIMCQILTLLLACIFAGAGSPSFLKLHYIKVLEAEGISCND